MARLIPFISPQEITNAGEREVAVELERQLPDDCLVFHSYPWLREERRNPRQPPTLHEGEADFVIIHPKAGGLLVLEVKEGQVEHDPETQEWHRVRDDGTREEIKDPFGQARTSCHHLVDEIRKHGCAGRADLPFAFGYAAFFPDCEHSGPPPRGAANSVILTAPDLRKLDRRIPEAIHRWSKVQPPRALEKHDMEAIRAGLMPCFQLIPTLRRRVEAEEEQLIRLTDEQLRLLEFLGSHERAAIEGVAGSGKTLLAMAQARRFAAQGRKTLLLCFNRALAGWLRSHLSAAEADKIIVGHFHGLAGQWCQQAGVPFDVPQDGAEAFWREDAPLLLLQAAEKLGLQFDAIVVDEGQDFLPDWWEAIESLNARGRDGALYVFYDPEQNLYVSDGLSIPISPPPFHLSTNCRNTINIARQCSAVIGRELKVHAHSPLGSACHIAKARNPAEQLRRCDELVRDWCRAGKLSRSQVAILGPRQLPHSSLQGVDKVGGLPLTDELDAWEHDRGILYSTIRSFKGLEADGVILMDLHEIDERPYFTRADLYVACTRAKHLLALLQVGEGQLARAAGRTKPTRK